MKMIDPKDPDLNALMQEYGAPLDDAGFSDRVMKAAARQAALRRGVIGSACFIGGIIAASQLKVLGGILRKFAPQTPDMSAPFGTMTAAMTASTSGSIAFYVCAAMIAGFTIWLAKDALDSQI